MGIWAGRRERPSIKKKEGVVNWAQVREGEEGKGTWKKIIKRYGQSYEGCQLRKTMNKRYGAKIGNIYIYEESNGTSRQGNQTRRKL